MSSTESKAFLNIWRHKDRRPIYEWAAENVCLKPPFTITGAFDVSRSRHFIEIFDALKDDSRREVNILKPRRGGGTLIADIWGAWTRVNDPGPLCFLMQTDRIADEHEAKCWRPILEKTPEIAAMLASLDCHKRSGNVIEFSDGNHYHIQGPSLGNLQSIGFRYMIEDEVWMWGKGKIGEADAGVGDYLKQQRSKILRISQGGPVSGVAIRDDDWARVFGEAEIHEWEVECPSCHQYMPPEMGATREDGSYWGLQWEKYKLPNGDWHISKVIPTVRFECRHCAHIMLDGARTKGEWNRTGRYRLTNEANRNKVSFRWQGVIDYPWDYLVELWLESCNAFDHGDPEPKLQFYHKRFPRLIDLEGLMRGGLHLKRVEYDVNTAWPEEVARYLTIDRQERDVFWWQVRAWSRKVSRRIGFGKAFSFEELEALRKKHKVKPERTFCDSRFQPRGDHGVFAACAKYGWRAVMGDSRREFLHSKYVKRPVLRSYSEGRWEYADIGRVGPYQGRCVVIFFSKSRMNAKVQELIDAGVWEEPEKSVDKEMEKEYNAQMASRFRRTVFSKKTNEVQVYWYEGKNDHARDLANQQVLGAMQDDILSDPATEQLTRTEAGEHARLTTQQQ